MTSAADYEIHKESKQNTCFRSLVLFLCIPPAYGCRVHYSILVEHSERTSQEFKPTRPLLIAISLSIGRGLPSAPALGGQNLSRFTILSPDRKHRCSFPFQCHIPLRRSIELYCNERSVMQVKQCLCLSTSTHFMYASASLQ